MSVTILVVDDEPDIRSTVSFNLEREGFRTIMADSGRAALELARAADQRPDLIVLDLMLPDISGTDVCRELRQGSDTRRIPILMLTAKTEAIDRVVGFELGADDYVTKPFSPRELVLRIKAILRRAQPGTEEPEQLRFGILQVDATGHRVWVGGEEVVLTALEFKLLAQLVKRRGWVQTREALLSHVWEMNGDVTTRTVDTHVRRLRQKLGPAREYVETLRGVGYRFKPDAGE